MQFETRCLQWSVEGKPIPQKRHRHTYAGRVYDPCTEAKRVFLQSTRQVCPLSTPLAGPLNVEMLFEFPRPKSHVRKGGLLRASAPTQHTQTPDIDNLAKFVMDALNGACFEDDKQVVRLVARKRWAPPGKPGRTVVSICATADEVPSSASCPARPCRNADAASASAGDPGPHPT